MPSDAYIAIIVSTEILERACPDLLTESLWKPSGISDLWVRIDPERPEIKGRRHVHVAHAKHINATNRQVSWNDDTSRHDRGRFYNGFKGVEMAKAAARIALKLPDDVQLESKHIFNSLNDLLLEGLEPYTFIGVPEVILETTQG